MLRVASTSRHLQPFARRGGSPSRRLLFPVSKKNTTTRHRISSTTKATTFATITAPLWKETTTTGVLLMTRAAAIGTVAGLITSLVGMGGALFMIPALTAAPLRLTQHAAHGTALFAGAVTGLTGAWTYRSHLDTSDLLPTATMAVSGMLSARFGAQLTSQLSSRILKKSLGGLMLILACAMPLKDSLQESLQARKDKQPSNQQKDRMPQQVLTFAAVGGASGFLAGLFGVSGGIVVIPALTVFTEPSSHYQVLATSLLTTSLLGVAGTWIHACAGNVVWRVAPALAAGVMLGATMGGRLGQQTDETTLKTGFTGLMVVLGLRTLFRV